VLLFPFPLVPPPYLTVPQLFCSLYHLILRVSSCRLVEQESTSQAELKRAAETSSGASPTSAQMENDTGFAEL
jgi:hypothetical protein